MDVTPQAEGPPPPSPKQLSQKQPPSQEAVLCELETLSHFSIHELERIKREFDAHAVELGGRHGPGIDATRFTELFRRLFSDGAHSEDEVDRCASYVFRALDLNRDGKLSLREFTAGLSTVVKGTAAERCRFWFRCMDADADGGLSRDELFEMVHSSIAVRNALLASGAARKESRPRSFRIDNNIARQATAVVDRCFVEGEAVFKEGEERVNLATIMSKGGLF